MGLNYRFGFLLVLAALFFVSYFVPYSYSKGASEWSFYGTVADGSTCTALQGVSISAIYNSNETNITNSSGGYLLRLGFGSWNVTFSKSGYETVVYKTPDELAGGYTYNVYLLPVGKKASNCSSKPNQTVTSLSTTVATSIANFYNTTTIPPNNQSSGHSTAGILSRFGLLGLGSALFVMIIAILLLGFYIALKIKNRRSNPGTGDQAQ